MRVLHVIGPLRTGGAQTQLLGLIRAAHDRLWNATVVATSGGALEDEFEALGCPITVLRRIGSPGLGRMWKLRRLVRHGDFDVIHGNLWQSNLYCRVAVVGMRNRPAVVISERNVEAGRSLFKRLLDRGLAPVTDVYVGNTDAVGDFIARAHAVDATQIVVISNAVDRGVFHPPTEDRQRRTARVGAVGRLDAEKGFDVLVDAARLLANDRPVEFVVVGEGIEREGLESQAAGLPVTFLGPLRPGASVAEFLRSLDVFVLPSTFREGRPNVILEALVVGLPVVTTDIEGMSEIFRGPTLVPPSDSAALATAIESALDDPLGWHERSDPVPVKGFDQLAQDYQSIFQRVAADHDRAE